MKHEWEDEEIDIHERIVDNNKKEFHAQNEEEEEENNTSKSFEGHKNNTDDKHKSYEGECNLQV